MLVLGRNWPFSAHINFMMPFVLCLLFAQSSSAHRPHADDCLSPSSDSSSYLNDALNFDLRTILLVPLAWLDDGDGGGEHINLSSRDDAVGNNFLSLGVHLCNYFLRDFAAIFYPSLFVSYPGK